MRQYSRRQSGTGIGGSIVLFASRSENLRRATGAIAVFIPGGAALFKLHVDIFCNKEYNGITI
jgi:hypothetical protein